MARPFLPGPWMLVLLTLNVVSLGCTHPLRHASPPEASTLHGIPSAQVPVWSAEDAEFYLHGSMSSEFIPERVLDAFISTYPDLFPGGDLSAFGVIYHDRSDLPVGFSRREIPHLGRQVSVGINCAACHVGKVDQLDERPPTLVLGKASQLNVYAFFGTIAIAMVRTAEPANMERFLKSYLDDPGAETFLVAEVGKQWEAIRAAIASDPEGSGALSPGELHELSAAQLALDREALEAGVDLVPLVRSLLQLFHNVRTALHIPAELPPPVPTLPGPGRTDAFGVLAASFFGFPTTFEAPVKYGITWDLSDRRWVHWDGNNDEPLARNLGAALGLGAAMLGNGRLVNFDDVRRHTNLTQSIRAPRYPFEIDRTAADRGAGVYEKVCASCHDVPDERRLFTVKQIATDPNRALFFDDDQADRLNRWVASLEVPGYRPPPVSFRSTQKYWANDMAGVWARSPYLHNGSVRTMWDLLSPEADRPTTFRRGSQSYDAENMGYEDEGAFVFDTTLSGNSGSGHNFGTDLSARQKRELIEYLKTR